VKNLSRLIQDSPKEKETKEQPTLARVDSSGTFTDSEKIENGKEQSNQQTEEQREKKRFQIVNEIHLTEQHYVRYYILAAVVLRQNLQYNLHDL
jgi:hypothetical protein